MIQPLIDVEAPGRRPWPRLESPPAWLGLAVLAALAAGGGLLFTVGVAQGAPAWAAFLFLALALTGIGAYGILIYGHYRRLERRLPEADGRFAELEAGLVAAFAQLGVGDLVRAIERSHGLPERLAMVFAAATEALTGLARQIQDSSIEVAGVADAVNAIAADIAAGSAEQAASVVEITAAMEELARTASQIAGNAGRQAALAERAETSGDVGAVAVEEAVAGVEEVQKRISAIASRADALGTRSKEIYRVLDLITEIAQETHILSLNAAIEAVAAGAEGRRFSVVAEEVRRLAHRSQESVESVRSLLDEFAGSIRATIVATEEGSKEATRVLDRARSAAAAIGELKSAAADTARTARQISLATQQQNSASDEVVMTLREVTQVVQRMTGGLKDLTVTADRLNQLALTIQMLAQSFHLQSPRSLKHVVEEWAAKLEAVDRDRIEQVLDEMVQGAPFAEIAYFVDSRGYTLALCSNREIVSDKKLIGIDKAREVDMRQRPWFRIVERERRTSLTPLYESLQGAAPCFSVVAPVRGEGGELAGVLGVDIHATGWTRI